MIDRKNILFIATNIPTPQRKLIKGVVLTIACKLQQWYDISVLHPSERIPFPLSLFKKFQIIASSKPWNNSGININPFKFIRLPGKRIPFLLLPLYKRKIKRYCLKHGIPSLCHAHFVLPDAYFAYLIYNTFHTPYIVSFRQSDQLLLSKLPQGGKVFKMAKTSLNNAAYIIVHNQEQKEYVSSLGFESILMAHGIEKDYLEPRLLGPKESINITTIGDLIPLKHIDWVIQAVNDYHGKATIHLSIIGQGYLREKLEALSSKERISFMGQLPPQRVAEVLSKSDIFALPSYPETFGVAFLEAAAKSNAVIARKNAGVWGHFIDGEEMLFCDSYPSFQEMLYKLIDDDNARNQLAFNAFIKTKENYTWDKIIDKYTSIYQRLFQASNE